MCPKILLEIMNTSDANLDITLWSFWITIFLQSMKPLNQLKTIHNEHYAKLQSKHASETELLDDMRLVGIGLYLFLHFILVIFRTENNRT